MANGLIGLALRIYKGYNPPAYGHCLIITKIFTQQPSREPGRRNQEGTLHGSALLGLRPKSHKGMATTP